MATPRVLVVGGLDPAGGAGISADARVAQVLGALALPVATSLTVQNRRGMQACAPVERSTVTACLRAAIDDGELHAVKTGLFADAATVDAVAELIAPLRRAGVPLVVDPVLAATAGGWQGAASLVAALRERLLPLATVVTPNLPELERLANGDAGALRRLGPAVLLKGGHAGAATLVDRLLADGDDVEFHHPRLDRGPVHGTGCALATSLACRLARGASLEAACGGAIAQVQACLRATPPSGDGCAEPLVIVGD